MLRWILILTLVPCLAGFAQQGTPTADEIMARVAASQDRVLQQRAEYVYQQHIHIATRKTNGKLMREETSDYLVMPTPDGTKKELKQIVSRGNCDDEDAGFLVMHERLDHQRPRHLGGLKWDFSTALDGY